MSHFYVLALVEKEEKDIEKRLTKMLAPYDENKRVPTYKKKCYCIGNKAKSESSEAVYKKLGNYGQFRERFGVKNKARQDAVNQVMSAAKDVYTKEQIAAASVEEDKLNDEWQKFIEPLRKAEEAAYKKHPMADKPDPKCDDCEGTGKMATNYNPKSKWDWYTIGGRWTGSLVPEYDPTKDPENIETCFLCNGTGKRTDKLGNEARLKDPKYGCNGCGNTGKNVKFSLKKFVGDILPVSAIPEDSQLPYAIVAPDGSWHQKGEMGWFGMSSNEQKGWNKKAKALIAKHADKLAVVVDCHI